MTRQKSHVFDSEKVGRYALITEVLGDSKQIMPLTRLMCNICCQIWDKSWPVVVCLFFNLILVFTWSVFLI